MNQPEDTALQKEADEAYTEWQESKLRATMFEPLPGELWVSVPQQSKKITQ